MKLNKLLEYYKRKTATIELILYVLKLNSNKFYEKLVKIKLIDKNFVSIT